MPSLLFYPTSSTPPAAFSNACGLVDEAALTVQSSPIVATSGQLIENLDFTTQQAGPHIRINANVTGVHVRNCRFAGSGANNASFNGDGGAIMASQGSGFLIEHNDFTNCFRALRVEGSGGAAIDGTFVFNSGTDLYRNFVFVVNANCPGFTVAYNCLEWRLGNFRDDYLTTTGTGTQIGTAFHQQVEDGIGFYNSSGNASNRILILGNRTRHRDTAAGQLVSTTGAGYSVGDNTGSFTEVRSNLSWNTATNGIQASSGSNHLFHDNIVYHDGTDTSLYGSSGGQGLNTNASGGGAFVTNRGIQWQNYNNGGCPSGANVSDGNLVYYVNNFNVERAFQLIAPCTAEPAGNDPIVGNAIAPNNWDGVTGGDITARWNNWQTNVDSLIGTYGRFGATL